jgi:hypothetical protein
MQHDLLAVRHFGFNKTMELISKDVWWPQNVQTCEGIYTIVWYMC